MQSCCARTIAFGDLRTVLGLRSDVYAGRVGDLLRHIHEEDQKRVLDGIAQARDSHTPYSAEFRVVRDDQSTRWVSARGRFEYSETGKPRRMRGMAVDISERNRADDLRKAYDINQRLALLAHRKEVQYLDLAERSGEHRNDEIEEAQDYILAVRGTLYHNGEG